MAARRIRLDYTPRAPFVDFHHRDWLRAFLCCHRRAGKTWAVCAELIVRALRCPKKNPRFWYVAPFRNQGKDILWTELKAQCRPFASKINEGDLRIHLPARDGSEAWITVVGASDPDTLRGKYGDGVVLDEFQQMKDSILGEVVLPMLADRNGWLVIAGTPRGPGNHFHTRYMTARENPDCWYSTLQGVDYPECPLSAEILDDLRKEMGPVKFRQEMMCDFAAENEGAIYGPMIEEMRRDKRIGEFPYDPKYPVSVTTDIGFSDAFALWWWQRLPTGVRLIKYEENQLKPPEFYTGLIKSQPYNYDTVWLPHDARARHLAASGNTVVMKFLEEGLPVRVIPRPKKKQNLIDAGRALLGRCVFHQPGCAYGLDLLARYQYLWDENRNKFADDPYHDDSSHAADAFGYLGWVYADQRFAKEPAFPADLIDPKTGLANMRKYTPADLERYRKAKEKEILEKAKVSSKGVVMAPIGQRGKSRWVAVR